jgi:hypothetical protein
MNVSKNTRIAIFLVFLLVIMFVTAYPAFLALAYTQLAIWLFFNQNLLKKYYLLLLVYLCAIAFFACLALLIKTIRSKESTKEKKKEEEKETWTDPNFEKLRIALMNHYNTQTLAHAGYIVALMVGIVTLFSRIDTFMDFSRIGIAAQFLCYAVVSVLLSLIIYVAFRILFWAWMSTNVLAVTKELADKTKGLTEIYRIQEALKNTFNNEPFPITNLYFGARIFANLGIVKSLSVLFIVFLIVLYLIYGLANIQYVLCVR